MCGLLARRGRLLVCLLLALITFAAYWQVFGSQFVNYDDNLYVTENSQVLSGLNRHTVAYAFTTTHASNWHPLTWLSLLLDRSLFGPKPWGFHLTNLLLHIANTLLLFLLVSRMTGFVWRSAFVAALFAVHPLHVESVAWVAERKDVLSTLFWLLTIWAYVRYAGLGPEAPGGRSSGGRESPRHQSEPLRHQLPSYVLVLLFFVLGLMAKPMLVSLPVTLLLLDYWPLGRYGDRPLRDSRRAWKLVREKIPLFALAAASGAITFLAQHKGGAMSSLETYPFGLRAANAVVAYSRCIGKMLWPDNLSVFYPLPKDTIPAWQVAGAGLLLVCATLLVLRAGRRRPYLPVGWFWYVITLFPTIGIVQVGIQAMADRYTYVPLIGLFVIIAWGVPDLLPRKESARLLAVPAGLVIAALALLTWVQVGYWRNSVTLFRHALASTRNNLVALDNLGAAMMKQGKVRAAMRYYERALSIRPNNAEALTNLGAALSRLGKLDQAIAKHNAAVEIRPGFAEAHYNLGVSLENKGDRAGAEKQYAEAVRLKPDYAEAQYNLGLILARKGRLGAAEDHFTRALRARPDYADAHYNLGLVLAQREEYAGAASHFAAALRLKPCYRDAEGKLGMALVQEGKPDEAVPHLTRALKANPDDAVARTSMGIAMAQGGDMAAAIEHFSAAARIVPNDAEARYNLARALEQAGRTPEAIRQYREALRLDPRGPEAANNLAWLFATNPDAGVRDPREAVRLAEFACRLTSNADAGNLDTLAAAYAAAGRFKDAVSTGRKALDLAGKAGRSDLADQTGERLRLYERGKAYVAR